MITIGSFLSGLACKIVDIYKKVGKKDATINEVLLYGGENEDMMKQVGLNNLFCIYYVMMHANRSVDVCVPSLVSETIAKCLVNVQQKNNVKVRVAIHRSYNFHNLQTLAQSGIEVKVIKSVVGLEHEFALIDSSEDDDDSLAVLGSLDYATDRVNCNRDATILTSEPIVIRSLRREFDRMWSSVVDIPDACKG